MNCRYGHKRDDQVACDRPALPGHTTCPRHYSAGRQLTQEERRRARQKREPRVVRKAMKMSQGIDIIPNRLPFDN